MSKTTTFYYQNFKGETMIAVTHLNTARPEMGHNVYAISIDGYHKQMHLAKRDDIGLDEDDWDEIIWYDEDSEDAYSLNDYPFWVDEIKFNIPQMSDYSVKAPEIQGAIVIPGYKIVGGTVVKA
jgi:hypothetical protein